MLEFLYDYQKCILVGVDEDTISILVKKLKSVDREKFNLVKGFTYWKRVLKYLDIDGYKNIDLEEYYTILVGHNLPGFNTATDIAAVLMKSVMEVTNKSGQLDRPVFPHHEPKTLLEVLLKQLVLEEMNSVQEVLQLMMF